MDARWPPKSPKERQNAPLKSTTALDDTLMDLQHVSDLLDKSLKELKVNNNNFVNNRKISAPPVFHSKSATPPEPPRRVNSSGNASPLNSPARLRKHRSLSQESRLSGAQISFPQQKSASPYFRSSVSDKMSDYEDIWMDTILKDRPGKDRLMQILSNELNFPKQPEVKLNSNASSSLESSNKSWSKMSTTSTISSTVPLPKEFVIPKIQPDNQTIDTSSSLKLSKISIDSSSKTSSLQNSSISSTTEENLGRNCTNDQDVVYSDPLDALEQAEDTRIYNCPDFSEMSEIEEKHEDNNLTDVECKETSKYKESHEEFVKSEGEISVEVGCSLTKVRKTSHVKTRSRKISSDNEGLKKRENRLSAVIGKYIKPPKALTIPGR